MAEEALCSVCDGAIVDPTLCAQCARAVGERGAQAVSMLQRMAEEKNRLDELLRSSEERFAEAERERKAHSGEVERMRALLVQAEEEGRAKEAEMGAMRAALKEERRRAQEEAGSRVAELQDAQGQTALLMREGREALQREKALQRALKEKEAEVRSLKEEVAHLNSSKRGDSEQQQPVQSQAAQAAVQSATNHEMEQQMARTLERCSTLEEANRNLTHALKKLLEEKSLWQENKRRSRPSTPLSAVAEEAPSLLDELNVAGVQEQQQEPVAAAAAAAKDDTPGASLSSVESYQFFVHLCCQAVKIQLQMQHPEQAEAYAAINTKPFYYQALVESIPFHELFDWVKSVFMQEVVNRSPRPQQRPARPIQQASPAKKKGSSFWDSLFGSSKKSLSADVGNVCGTLALLQKDQQTWLTRFFMFNATDKKMLWSEDEKHSNTFLGVLPLNAIQGVSPVEIPGRPFAFKLACVDDSMSLILAAPDNNSYQAWIHLISKLC